MRAKESKWGKLVLDFDEPIGAPPAKHIGTSHLSGEIELSKTRDGLRFLLIFSRPSIGLDVHTPHSPRRHTADLGLSKQTRNRFREKWADFLVGPFPPCLDLSLLAWENRYWIAFFPGLKEMEDITQVGASCAFCQGRLGLTLTFCQWVFPIKPTKVSYFFSRGAASNRVYTMF